MNGWTTAKWKDVPELREADVQVFAVRAVVGEAFVAGARELLSLAERERAARFRVEEARAEFVVGRALLRSVLAHATGCSPSALALQTDVYGKPFAAGVHGNVSHSRGLVYVAVCRSGPVGVDVEWIDPTLEALQLAEENFTAGELALVAAASAGVDRARVFCRLWTRKEAVAKAYGRGLQIPLQALHVPEEGGPAFVHLPESDQWRSFHLSDLPAPEGFAAALAMSVVGYKLQFLPAAGLLTSKSL